MKSLRIVLVMIEPPLPFGNAAARWYYVLLRGLVDRGHRVTAFAACSKAKEIDEARALFPAPAYDFRPYPFPARTGLSSKIETLLRPYSYMFGRELKADLLDVLDSPFDVLHLESLSSGWLGLDHTQQAIVNVHFLYSIDLADARGSWLARWQMNSVERHILRAYPRVCCLSDRLAAAVRDIAPQVETIVVPLGLDLDRYTHIPDDRRTTEPVIGLIGSMGWHPSRSAAVRLLTRIWPRVREQVPEARVQIVGWDARTALREFIDMDRVTIEENVPDALPYFERTAVMVYPPGRGSGMKVKVLEAFAIGVPVVTTAEGVEGIPAQDGIHAGICEDDEGLAARTVELLRDPVRQNRQRAAARRLLQDHCGPGPTLDAVERVYERLRTSAEPSN